MKNQIREHRLARGLSYEALAAAARIGPRQLRRIETGHQTCKANVAMRLCAALQTDLFSLFPDVKPLMRKYGKRGKSSLSDIRLDDDALRDFELTAGIDLDSRHRTVALQLRGGAQGEYPLSSWDAQRLADELVRLSEQLAFFSFHSHDRVVVINLRHLLHYVESAEIAVVQERGEELDQVRVYSSDSKEAKPFSVEPDEEESDEEESTGQFRELLFSFDATPDESDFVCFFDFDGNRVVFRISEITLMEIPLWAVDARLIDEDEEGDHALSNGLPQE